MTKLETSKPVVRTAKLITDHRREARDNIVVTIYPNQTIGFRRARCKDEVTLPLATVYSMALKADAYAKAAEKRKGKR